MNILLIGNGFDLAHGLPTSYKDFLFFIKYVEYCRNIELGETKMPLSIPEADNENQKKIVDFIEDKINYVNTAKDDKSKNIDYKDIIEKVYNITFENIWINYFYDNKDNIGKDWVDFESEISVIVRIIEESLQHDCYTGRVSLDVKKVYGFCEETNRNSINLLKIFKDLNVSGESKTYSFIAKLNKDLDNLIIALQIYLYYFANNIGQFKCKKFIKDLNVDKVISFNYTDTYKRLYDNSEWVEYNYIHGKVNENNSSSKVAVVLGIEEYFSEEQQNKYLEFVSLKKYYQRIIKHTDSKYYDWIKDIQKEQEEYYNKLSFKEKIKLCIWILKEKFKDIEHNLPLPQINKEQHNLYIIGHSLDVTDGDVLRTLIVNDNVVTTIYYHDEKSHNEKIENLIRIIGKNELIKRTSGKNQTIFFVEQPKENKD